MKNNHELTPEQLREFDEAMKAIDDDSFGLNEEETELPPLYNPNAKTNFTDEEIGALTATNDDESIALAFKRATPEEKPLLKPDNG